MTAQDFVDTIRRVVLEASITDTISIVTKPPGRRPADEIVELSRWFNGLAEQDRTMVRGMLKLCAHGAVFGMLAVIDGARQVETAFGPKGSFELTFTKDGHQDVLGGPRGKLLHEFL